MLVRLRGSCSCLLSWSKSRGGSAEELGLSADCVQSVSFSTNLISASSSIVAVSLLCNHEISVQLLPYRIVISWYSHNRQCFSPFVAKLVLSCRENTVYRMLQYSASRIQSPMEVNVKLLYMNLYYMAAATLKCHGCPAICMSPTGRWYCVIFWKQALRVVLF